MIKKNSLFRLSPGLRTLPPAPAPAELEREARRGAAKIWAPRLRGVRFRRVGGTQDPSPEIFCINK